jgi:type I restriction enzyme M protein
MPENLFYNTPSPGVIVVLNRHKNNGRKGQLLLINAANHFVKEKPKNKLTDEGIAAVTEVFRGWETREKLSRVVTMEQIREEDYNLSVAAVLMRSMPAPKASVGTNVFATCAGFASTRMV